MKNTCDNEKRLLNKLKNRDNVTINFKNADWIVELAYDAEDKVYRTAKNGFYRFELEFLIDIANGIDKEIELF